MAGWGHKNLARIGFALRPYLNPDAVEVEEKKSSRYTKPLWQRELEQAAALRATEAKRKRGELSIRKSDIAGEELDKAERLRALMESGRAAGTDAGTIEGARAAFHNARGSENPDIARVGRGTQHADMPLSQQDREANEILYRDTMGEKPADILTKAFSGEMAADYKTEKDELARAVIKDETAALRKQGVVDINRIRLENEVAADKKRELQAAQAAEDREAKIAAKALKVKHNEEKAALLANEKDRKRNDAIAKEQRRISLANLKFSRQRQERRDKVEADAAKALAIKEAKEQKAFDTKVEKRMAEIMAQHPVARANIKPVALQNVMANKMFGEEGAGGSMRAGFDATQDTVADEEWARMLTKQERNVILDQLWRHAVNIANSKGTSAHNEYNLLSLAISQGKMSPYDFLDVTTIDPNAPTTRRAELQWPASAKTLGGFLGSKLRDFGIDAPRVPIPMDERETITQPDIQVRSEGDLLAALQQGDTLGNHVYKVNGVGAFQWDNATQKFVKLY